MTPSTDPAMVARAFALADSCARSDIECYGVPVGEAASMTGWYALTNDHQQEVRSLDQAGALLREAFEWLRDRGLARIEKDDGGEIVVLELEKFG